MLAAPSKSKGKKVGRDLTLVSKQQAAKTAAATKRKQDQRAREKNEKDSLLTTERELQGMIDMLMKRFKYPVVILNQLPTEIRDAVLENRERIRAGNDMKKRLQELYEVQQILSRWVFAHYPHEGLQPKPTMMETTLLGHDECRQFGHLWLCQKGLNMALTAHPYEPFLGKVDDNIISWPHMGEDDTGSAVEAVQFHSQYSVMGDYRDVAAVLWDTYHTSSPDHIITIVDKVNDDCVYSCVEYGPVRSKILHLAGIFRLKHRIIVTITVIAYDERFPMKYGETRIHGFGWMILDEMGDKVTLCRQSHLQYAPVNKDRRLTLEELGQMLHYRPELREPRENVVVKFQEMVENGYTLQRDYQIRPHFPVMD
ncbi:hypothetical protein LEN26_017054 [Aphanomyces euteiches]|nr:hypothetical protein LEN26_017054 [Aphanomyces euteiches]KAH9110909.1 hypothetical protein AeMF1_014448 [Aphanomyces euteiches]KAH9180194.1 hypothetical protein AeNC1_017162 [Aphanomyces euteiches]